MPREPDVMPELPVSSELSQHINLLWAQGNSEILAGLDSDAVGLSENEQAYIAMALLQQSKATEAQLILTALVAKGFDRQRLASLLLSGCKTSLSNACYINGDDEKAKRFAFQAVALTEPELTRSTVLQLREIWQQKRLHKAGVEFRAKPLQYAEFNVKTLKQLKLCDAWAGNTVNTVIFRHHGVFSHAGMQYTAFYVDKHTLRLAQRNLTNNELLFADITGNYNIKDAHNSISLGMDRNGYIHISYDHHGTQLKYRRSLKPYSIDGFSDELEMTGQREAKVTYPAFIMQMADEPMQLLYRDGNHQKGSAYIKHYCETEQRWIDTDSAILSGETNQPWTSNAYWNHPVLDSEGNGHLSFVWRTHHIGEQQQINNMNICYAKTYDHGKTWYSSNNKQFKLPITQVNAEVVWPISPASNLINQTSMAIDSKNRPHIVFYANDEHGIVQYQHLWFNGNKWQHQIISNRTEAFDLCGGGTLRIPISRPELVIDKQDNLFVIYRGDITGDCMAALCLKAPHYRYEPANQQVIFSEPLGLAEPVIDRLRWQQDQVLSLLVQYNDQPNHDLGHAGVVKPIYLIDIVFNV
jgi:hypothetical protein